MIKVKLPYAYSEHKGVFGYVERLFDTIKRQLNIYVTL